MGLGLGFANPSQLRGQREAQLLYDANRPQRCGGRGCAFIVPRRKIL